MTEPIAFSSTTSRHGLPLLVAGQAQKEFFVNESLALIDMLLHPAVAGLASAPPASPAIGECWIVGVGASDAWIGCEDALAGWDGTQWSFAMPMPGLKVLDLSSSVYRTFGNGWSAASAVISPTGGSIVDAEARATIDGIIAALQEQNLIS